ncbi:uncharacterized protein DC041_0008352 [Schistosoma bovis]|uniref:Uncharacterized protein n=1 Tax=Schistosoma bovis TaxID=6184 RepID=A0A430QCX9_SCHBO|nr:uncharacterized protein DC041_0008352 [Schistosoma bovis]
MEKSFLFSNPLMTILLHFRWLLPLYLQVFCTVINLSKRLLCL